MGGMAVTRGTVLGWVSAVLLAAVPWAGWTLGAAVAPVAAAAVLVVAPWRVRPGADPAAAGLEVLSGSLATAVAAGWLPAAIWVGSALAVAAVAFAEPAGRRQRELTAGLALAAWAIPLAVRPGTFSPMPVWTGGAVLFLGARRLGLTAAWLGHRRRAGTLGPPTREVRGALELAGVVAASPSGLPATRPVTLTLAPGQSAAILLDRVSAAGPLVEAIRGRTPPAEGTVRIDGEPVGEGERLVAVVAPGEPMLPGGVEPNLLALSSGPVTESQRTAAVESCSLDEVSEALERGDGLGVLHALLLQAARVMVSHYRVVVVMDPSPWVNTVLGEIWRRAVVRASVGRTAVWITADRELAARADRVLVLRAGVLAEEEQAT